MCDSEVSGSEHPAAPPPEELERLMAGRHSDPHSLLGVHRTARGLLIRALRPYASGVTLEAPGDPWDQTRLDALGDGLFGALLPVDEIGEYWLTATYARERHRGRDGYRRAPTLNHADLAAFAEGIHYQLWRLLGAQPVDGTDSGSPAGVRFSVWAPHAEGVTVTGDFDRWSGRTFPMRLLDAGVWEVLVPGAEIGQLYKFRVHTPDGRVIEKADPMAFATEIPPANASRITASRYLWADSIWMRARKEQAGQSTAPQRPLSVYELHAGSWRKHSDGSCLTYREIAAELIPYVSDAGFTHVEFLPLTEHPFGGSWGYQVSSYYAPTARHGTPDDLRFLIDQLHRAGIGVIFDWVPAHFPRDDWALARFDSTALYEHANPLRGEHPEWGTYIFDWGKPEVRSFLIANALYWLTEFHVDGLRVDAVASMLYLDYSRPPGAWEPNEIGGRENLEAVSFLQQLNCAVEQHAPGAIMIAEDSTTWPKVTRQVALGGLGFTFKWNMRWMNDILHFVARPYADRPPHHSDVTSALMYAWSENYVLPLSHDEVVHGKGTLWSRMPGKDTAKAAGVRALLGHMWAHPGKKLLFMGQEFGQSAEWSEARGLDWFESRDDRTAVGPHTGIAELVRELNRLYRTHPALWERDGTADGFSWIDSSDNSNSVVSYLRHASGGRVIACIVNFSPQMRSGYRVGLPAAGRWREILNTDAEQFGGSGHVNPGYVTAEPEPWNGRQASVVLSLPPLTAMWFRPL
ncbi:1,4-alpha-glucan branching protein GlgB [Hoyosella subflava]|uniref:1,4-alpha-glucan branching enzyme GlgB n=1 Tax=Hoyosella subflava (strain DSM 45089 / JCM 17490 / NBRC 109087 / DQS3-9A1) TaxID=443218 RepID=F6ENK9_HOYSD|nr:1,4-alpha-glucan branching protein GlgB [Hoyosella subflava]AEF41678.1 1,4-alpha-glucan-branching enzyme [Hoyosella subflava DQS3-9A1]